MEGMIDQLKSEKDMLENITRQQQKELEKLNKYINVLKEDYDKSIRKYINEKMERRVVFAKQSELKQRMSNKEGAEKALSLSIYGYVLCKLCLKNKKSIRDIISLEQKQNNTSQAMFG